MTARILLNGAALAGSLIKFRSTGVGSVVVTHKNTSSDPIEFKLMSLAGALDASSPIEAVQDDKFVELQPLLSLTDEMNNAVIVPGNYALKVVHDGIYSIVLHGDVIDSDDSDPIEERLGRILTQYRESPNLKGLISTYLRQVEEVRSVLSEMPSKFDIDTAVGDQLTIVGKWLGFPRCHNVASPVPVAGFDCAGLVTPYNIRGFCEGAAWLGCANISSFDVCINDDELYRRFLYVRRYQLLGKNDYRSFAFCIRILFGSNASYSISGRIITVSPGRTLTDLETAFLKVYERVLPVAMRTSVTIST